MALRSSSSSSGSEMRTFIIKEGQKIWTKLMKVESKLGKKDQLENSTQRLKQINLLKQAQKLLDDYKKQINLDDEDTFLMKRLQESNKENRSIQRDLIQKEEQIVKLEEDLKNLRECLQKLEAQNPKKKTEENVESTSTSDDEQRFITKLKHQEEKLKELEGQQKEIIVDAQSMLDNLKKDQKTAIEKIESEKNIELDQLKIKLEDKDGEIEWLKGDIQKLNANISENGQHTQNLLGKIDQYEKHTGNLMHQINMGQAAMQRMEEVMRSYETKIRNMQLQIRDYQIDKESISGVLQVCEIEIKNLRYEVARLQSVEKRMKSVLVDGGSQVLGFEDTNRNPRKFERFVSAQDVVAEQEINLNEKRLQTELEHRFEKLFDNACAIINDEKAKNTNEEVETEIKMLHTLRDTLHQYYVFHEAKHQNNITNNDEDEISLQVSLNVQEQFPNYTQECDELCQSMVKHEPSLWLAFGDDIKGEEIDTDMFTCYKDSDGCYLDFVVWPALLLGSRGYILRKGIVKPITS